MQVACANPGFDHMFFVAAKTLADLVTEDDLAERRIYPCLSLIREVSAPIATAVADVAFQRGLTTMSRPIDLAAHVKAQMYEPTYMEYVWRRTGTAVTALIDATRKNLGKGRRNFT